MTELLDLFELKMQRDFISQCEDAQSQFQKHAPSKKLAYTFLIKSRTHQCKLFYYHAMYIILYQHIKYSQFLYYVAATSRVFMVSLNVHRGLKDDDIWLFCKAWY